ncbi:nuclear mitotic apparatus protein 1-like isoform X2 [Ctenopharyngodon idella]|uniref:nuclear mitotic apparatus protein 1-like isoform X2 n=1 Tax=Ctenopharyngodon idella TaxID=7959 RepID=UPI00222EB1AC|nr:nuclear mitotic apparatus protein 1-like isoform X2 [Ctenopharyngodon idella]
MELNGVKEAALLSWINSVCPEEPINKITQMMDGHRLLKLAYRVQGKESHDGLFLSPSPNMMEMFFSILQDDFQFSPRQASLMLWKISQGIELELQIAKVVLVLCYCGFTKYNMIPLDVKTGLMIASMFRFVEDDADGLSLDDDLNKFLTKASDVTFSTSSSGSSCWSPLYTDDKSPFIKSFEKPTRVQFQELVTVSCSLVSSPVQDVMSTPQLLKRLRKELAHGRDMKDALEKELANQINIISEKEGLIIQLQHRVDRMLREQQELEKDHKAALLELQEKNESLLHRVHEVLKQCQDLKTENRQKEKKMHELIEENQTFSAQLARAEEEVTKLTLAHETSQAEWRSRKEFLEHELNKAVSHKALNKIESLQTQEKVQELEKIVRKLQAEISALSSERDTQISALKTEMKNQQLKSDRLRAQLELKLEKQKTGILTLKNLAQQWEQQNKELLENLKILFKQLQHYSSKYQESQEIRTSLEKTLQMEQDQAKAKLCLFQVDFAEKRLQEWRKTIDDSEDVRCRESLSVHKRPGFYLHGTPDTPELASCISRTATVKSRHANRLSNSQPKQKQSVMFVIANTPKRSGGGSLLRRGLKLREDACKTPTVASRGLRPAVSAANGRSPQVSALRKCRRNKSSKTFNAKQVKSRIISGQTLDLFLSIIFLFVCLLYTL